MELTRSQRFIRDYSRKLKSSAEFFNKDSNLMTVKDYEEAKWRVLIVFPSPASTKAVSQTLAVMNDFVISSCPGVFIDFAFIPETEDIKYYDKESMPYALGIVTGLDPSHYDAVGFSISIHFEQITSVWILNTFSRCDKPIPLTWSERKDMKVGDVPIMSIGGILGSCTDMVFGDLGDGRKAFIDYIHLGEFHCVTPFYNLCIASRGEKTIQQVIEAFWDMNTDESGSVTSSGNWLYQPQAYEVIFNDRNQIVSNTKINPKAPDMCEPYYPNTPPKEIGAARGVILGNGQNAGLGQIFAANGCSRSGFCNFSVAKGTKVLTEYGLENIETLVNRTNFKALSAGVVDCKSVVCTGGESCYRVILESGAYLDCSLYHKFLKVGSPLIDGRARTYTTEEVRYLVESGEEFIVLRKIGNHFSNDGELNEEYFKVKFESVLSKDGVLYEYIVGPCEDAVYCKANTLATVMNYYGCDTNLIKRDGNYILEWWPVPNSVVQDRVVEVINLGYKTLMYDVTETSDSSVCYNSIITHNCHEGAYVGGWVEHTPERLVELAKLCKKYTAASSLKPYAFNMNYLSDFKRNIYDWLGIFPKVTFNNMRLEELGRDVDSLKMMKLSGSNRLIAPLEGISERIRNGILNKNLSKEALDNYLQFGLFSGAIDCKVGLIFTGKEEEQDWQELFDFNMEWKRKMKEMGGNIPFRYKVTMLVHYPHCLTKEALTPFPGKGLLRQDELQLGSVAGFDDDAVVTEVSKPFEDYAHVIETARGQKLVGNYAHPVLVVSPKNYTGGRDCWKTLSEVKPGDFIYCKLGTECFGDTNTVIVGDRVYGLTTILAEIVGWSKGKSRLIYFEPDGVAYRHADKMRALGYSCTTVSSEDGTVNVFKDTEARSFVEPMCTYNRVPDFILTSDKRHQCAFLRGFLSNDSALFKEGFKSYCESEDILRDVQAMLFNLGIDCVVRTEFDRKYILIKSKFIPVLRNVVGIIGKIADRQSSYTNYRGTLKGYVRTRVTRKYLGGVETFYGLTVSNHGYVTNGIMSHNTPLEYMERVAPRYSMEGTYIMPEKWNKAFYENNIRIQVNGFKGSTFIEQAIVDLGRSATPWLYRNFVQKSVPVYSLRSIANHDTALKELRDMINVDYFFKERSIDGYISVCHRIHISLHASVIYQAKKVLKDGVNCQPVPRCLKTQDNGRVECKKYVYRKEPLVCYSDVKINDEGKLEGQVWDKVVGCNKCKTLEERKWVLTRPLPKSKTSDDLIKRKAPEVKSRLRFRIVRRPEFEVLNPRNTAYMAMSAFTKRSDRLADIFWELDTAHTGYWQSGKDMTYIYSGSQIFDATFLEKDVLSIVTKMIPEVNEALQTLQIVSVKEVPLSDKIKHTDYNVYMFESSLPVDMWEYACSQYKGEVRVESDDMSGDLTTVQDPKLKAPTFILKDRVRGYFAIPCKYSPWHYLQGLMGLRHITLAKLLDSTKISCITTVREGNVPCVCGKEPSVYDLGSGELRKVGVDCIVKLLTRKL